MNIKGIGNGLKDKLQEATDAVKTGAKNVNIPGVDIDALQETAKETANKLTEQAKDAAGKLTEQTKDTAAKLTEQAKELPHKEEPAAAETADPSRGVSVISAVRLFYYMMAADGDVSDSEISRLIEIVRGLDASFEEDVKKTTAGCDEQINALKGEDESVFAEETIKDALEFTRAGDALIPVKLLLWDLLAIAFADQDYKSGEQAYVQHLAKELKIDKAVVLEMESSIRTVFDLENELKWIKTTDRPYMRIEAMVNEIEDRKTVILESINALISL